MLNLFIDGRPADIDSAAGVSLSYSVANVTAPEKSRTGYSKSIAIPMTARNMEIMGDCDQVFAIGRFNSENHTARIETEGFTIMDGLMNLTECGRGDGQGGWYKFNIIGSAKEWATHAAMNTFASLFREYEWDLSGELIINSWTDDMPFRLLPVLRDHRRNEGSDEMAAADVIINESDYHPFIPVTTALRRIFSDSGFGVESRFFDSPFGRSLHMSGNYHYRDVSLIVDRMDFLAAGLMTKIAYADEDGFVYADPARTYNSLGNIVDTANPKEIWEGKQAEDAFSNNGCFYREGDMATGTIVFRPTQSTPAGFEYTLLYTTDYRIKSTTELTGFDTISFSPRDTRKFSIMNKLPDRREEFISGKAFKCLVSGFRSGYRYELRAKRITNTSADPANLSASDYVVQTLAIFTSRMAAVQTSIAGTYVDLQVYEGLSAASMYLYTGDWALYDGYVTETGTTDVRLTIRSSAENLTSASPKYFNGIKFGGAEHGMRFVLKEAAMRPVFQLSPTAGSSVEFLDVAAHGISRMQFLAALRHLFNLHFYTDELSRTVHVEPRRSFFADYSFVDWTGRVDYSKPVTLHELGAGSYRTLTRCYKGGDGAVARWDVSTNNKLGRWSATVDNVHTVPGESVAENPLFSMALNTEGCVPSAVSASVMQVGNIKTQTAGSVDLNFTPKIACYAGMKDLPAGQRWGWPSYGTSYPFVAFHNPGGGASDEFNEDAPLPENFTLCFEDRDGESGLHRYWDSSIQTLNEGRRLTAYVKIWPEEIEAILYPNSLQRDLRGWFILDIEGERGLWRLEEVCGYNPADASTKCIFIKES